MGFSSLPFTANLMPERPRVSIPDDNFAVKRRCSFGRWPRLPRGDGKSQAAAVDRGYNSLSLLCNLLIDSPFAPKKFLKQFTAFLGEHTTVDIAAMI